jgi:hypothetical protein
MIKKVAFCLTLAGMMLVFTTARAQPASQQPQDDSGKQSEQATKSVSGKVVSIGNTGTSFTLEVDGSNKQTMEFVVNKSTQLKGQVKTGTLVAVDYQPGDGNGPNLAVVITARS